MKIGIETHIQLNTKTKLFCNCSNEVIEKPNTTTCEVCLGHPGSKPRLNQEAIIQAIKVALALDCKINSEMFFSRKSYFYPDLTKNYQITQYEVPLAENGELNGIRIRRIHLEEDPGKLIHDGNQTLIDYNRSGTPLIEVVTEPDFKSPAEVRSFLNKLTIILEYLGVYTRKSEASVRSDANISLEGGARVEVKNIGGIKDIEKALNYEVIRQEKALKNKEHYEQHTRAWNANTGTTSFLRGKETEDDYGYIFEPDLTKIEISNDQINSIKKTLPELAAEKAKRFVKHYKLSTENSKVLTQNLILAELFEKVSKKVNPVLAGEWVIRELTRVLHYNKKEIQDIKLNIDHFTELLKLLETKQITQRTAQLMLNELIVKDFSPKDRMQKKGLKTISSESELKKICEKVLQENKQAVEDYKAGEEKAIHFLSGQVMRTTKGTAEPQKVKKLLEKLI